MNTARQNIERLTKVWYGWALALAGHWASAAHFRSGDVVLGLAAGAVSAAGTFFVGKKLLSGCRKTRDVLLATSVLVVFYFTELSIVLLGRLLDNAPLLIASEGSKLVFALLSVGLGVASIDVLHGRQARIFFAST